MTNSANAIALISPLKDERENVEKYIESIEAQTVPIKCLVIVENDSTDGSAEYVDQLKSVTNVEIFKVIHMSFEDATYRVGRKYATIINEGLEWLKQQDFFDSLDFLGILDCDIFPEKEYYEKLITFLDQNPEVGITSGLIYTPEGKRHIADPNWVRGGCRLWKKQCFDEAGYQVVYAADTVSMALAHLKGWKSETIKSAAVVSREVNVKLGSAKSKGHHAYFRGHTLFYMILKFLYFTFKGRPRMAYERLSGYLQAMRQGKPRIENKEVRKYFRYYLFNKLIHKFK
jgi:glycosyltransferase involved in cell wall biosynthesis